VEDPKPVIYSFSKELDKVFNETLELIAKKFKYARYMPLIYFKGEIDENQKTPQRNMGKWMKILLLKRLESSFFAFKKSISRFMYSYKRFIEELEKGYVYTSEKYTAKLFELLEQDDIERVNELIEKDEATKYPATKFTKELKEDLATDLEILEKINDLWKNINEDPKLMTFIEQLKKDKNLKENKLLIFTESKETANYLEEKLNPIFKQEVMAFSSESTEAARERIIENYDPLSKVKKNDIRILVSTEILSEGVNLNRSNVVINYDIPWNPIRMMQRVGRINRVAKNLPYDNIFTYNFFPAGPINDQISLKEAAEVKIQSFIEMLGNDAKLLTDEEVKSHDLFRRLNSKEVLMGEEETDDPELEWLIKLRELRDNDKDLFEKIKKLPKKSRTARKTTEKGVVTFFRKGKLRKIYLNKNSKINELDFREAVKILKAEKTEKRIQIPEEFFKLLEENKKEFDTFFTNEVEDYTTTARGHEAQLKKIIKATLSKPDGLTDDDEEYLREVLNLIKEGAIPKQTMKTITIDIKKEISPLKIITKMKATLPAGSEFFQETYKGIAGNTEGPKEVILSEMLLK
jgi:superfamily II DNA/RNA helicase